jgi:hypothetical protein
VELFRDPAARVESVQLRKLAMNEVWMFAEQQDGRLKGVAYELATEGRRLADALETRLGAV